MVDKDAVREAYDDVAEEYAAQRIESGAARTIRSEFLGKLQRDAVVLDAGCGQGTPMLASIDPPKRALGIDFSREQLQLAASNAPDASVMQGDMVGLPVQSDVADAVIAFFSLIHVPIGDHLAALEEFARVLRPGGRLLVNEGTEAWTGENPDWLDSGVRMAWDIAGPERTREQLLEAGFAIRDEWRVGPALEADRESDAGVDDAQWHFFEAQLEE